MLKIRRYKPEDKEAVKALNYAGLLQMDPVRDFEKTPFLDNDLDDIENSYTNNKGEFIVGLEGGEIVAVGAVRKYSETCGEIKRIRVRRDCQRKGYAVAIMLELMELSRKLGYTELCLDTLVDNIPAQRLFEKLGFKEICRGMRGPYRLIYYGKKLQNKSSKAR